MIALRHSVVRPQRLNLDLGVVASQMRTTTNFDNGYCDPRLGTIVDRGAPRASGRDGRRRAGRRVLMTKGVQCG
jgi:hypothetical protein